MININLNISVARDTVPQTVIETVREIVEGLREYTGKTAKPERDTREEDLRAEWCKLTGRKRFKVTDKQSAAIISGETTIVEILETAIASISGELDKEEQEQSAANMPEDNGQDPYLS